VRELHSALMHGVTERASSWRQDQNVCKLWRDLDTKPPLSSAPT
jgi:hypothetical protein